VHLVCNALDLLQFVAVQGAIGTDLETVVLRRIVAGRHHRPTISAIGIGSEVMDGRGNYAYIRHVEPALQKASDQRPTDTWRAVTHVSAHHQSLVTLPFEESSDCLPQTYCYFIGQILIGNAPDAVLTEDVRIQNGFLGDFSSLLSWWLPI
jgi:hypothetical protein